jgi:hypothetical protein
LSVIQSRTYAGIPPNGTPVGATTFATSIVSGGGGLVRPLSICHHSPNTIPAMPAIAAPIVEKQSLKL